MVSRVKTGNGLYFLNSFDQKKIITDKSLINLIDQLKLKNKIPDTPLMKYQKEMAENDYDYFNILL